MKNKPVKPLTKKDKERIRRLLSGKGRDQKAQARFVLTRRDFRGPIVIRFGSSTKVFDLYIRNGGSWHLQLQSDPLKGETAGTVVKGEDEVTDTGGKTTDVFNLKRGQSVDLEPGSALNPTKETPATLEVVDTGTAQVLSVDKTTRKYDFSGESLKGGYFFKAEDEPGGFWLMSKSGGPETKGGPGSGHFGHGGRAGKVGGSAPGGSSSPQGIDSEVSSKVIEYMDEIGSRTGYTFKKTGTFAGGLAEDATIARGGGLTQKLELNSDVWRSKAAFREHMKKIPEGHFFSKAPKSFVVHEAGHGMAFQHPKDVPRLQQVYKSWRIPSGGKTLSEFSMANYREMTAEAFVAYYYGDKKAIRLAGLGDLIPIFDRWTGSVKGNSGLMSKNGGPETKGGPGSGNFGHAGRTGKVGGSAPGSSAGTGDMPAVEKRLRSVTQETGQEMSAIFDKDGHLLVEGKGSEESVLLLVPAGKTGVTRVHTHPPGEIRKYSTPSRADVNKFYQDTRVKCSRVLTADGGTWVMEKSGRVKKNLSGHEVGQLVRDVFDDMALGLAGKTPDLFTKDWYSMGYDEIGKRLGFSIHFYP